MDERMDVLGLPLLVLSMARKTLQSFKNSLNGKVSIKKKKIQLLNISNLFP